MVDQRLAELQNVGHFSLATNNNVKNILHMFYNLTLLNQSSIYQGCNLTIIVWRPKFHNISNTKFSSYWQSHKNYEQASVIMCGNSECEITVKGINFVIKVWESSRICETSSWQENKKILSWIRLLQRLCMDPCYTWILHADCTSDPCMIHVWLFQKFFLESM